MNENPKIHNKDQYTNSTNLSARINFHQQHNVSGYSWYRWVLDKIEIKPGSRILEIGCGDGSLWKEYSYSDNLQFHLIMSDISLGMVRDATANLGTRRGAIDFLSMAGERFALKDSCIDIVIANHMLYHVSDRRALYSEVDRVLTDKGFFYAATNGQAHLQEIKWLVEKFDADIEFGLRKYPFELETGEKELREWFSDIALYYNSDSIEINNPETIVSYVLSISGIREKIANQQLPLFRKFIANALSRTSPFRISRSTGLFEARKRNLI